MWIFSYPRQSWPSGRLHHMIMVVQVVQLVFETFIIFILKGCGKAESDS